MAHQVITIGTATETLLPSGYLSQKSCVKGHPVVVARNHPSGSLEPSSEDITLLSSYLVLESRSPFIEPLNSRSRYEAYMKLQCCGARKILTWLSC